MPKDDPQLISCDEAGYTGPNLRNESQPLFAYAAHTLSVSDATDLIAVVRGRRRREIQAPELKASSLRGRGDWPEIAAEVLEALEGRFLVIVMDKQLALAGKAFEYIIEPVIQGNNVLFYRYGLHRFVAAAVHRTIGRADGPAEIIAAELERFMRTFEPSDAPHLFEAPASLPGDAAVLRELLRFARGYRARIEAATDHLRRPSEIGKWVLDLTSAGLSSLLPGGLGQRFPVVDILCDESKPLLAMAEFFTNWVGRDEWVPIHAGSRMVRWRLNLAQPITFGRSIDHPTLQVADIAAGTAAEIYGSPGTSRLMHLKAQMDRHLHEDHILPIGGEALDSDDLAVRTNLHVLRHLAGRAELRQDPLAGMERVYAAAIKRFSHPASRLRPQRRSTAQR